MSSAGLALRLLRALFVPHLFALFALAYALLACAPEGPARERKVALAGEAVFPVEIPTPRVLEGLPIGDADRSGQPAVVGCRTCHAADAGPLPETAEQLKEPHKGLRVKHGTLRCASCHEPSAREKLRLADGRTIALTAAMELCSQCHGPQKRDYDHGAHGGMRGYWDLTRGPRERNHCVACHDPHAPQFGVFMPVSGPRDRFAGPQTGDAHE